MQGSDHNYHRCRAEKQRALAERCSDPAVARLHHTVADLHDERAAQPDGSRPVLRMVMPTA